MEKVIFPTHCPECGTKLIRYEGESIHYCPNSNGCPPQIKGKIEHFVTRDAMNIDGLGPETINLIYNHGLINNIADLYSLKSKSLRNLEGIGKKASKNIVLSIKASVNQPFERVLYALSIRFIGKTTAKKLAGYFNSLDNIVNASIEDLMEVSDIGVNTATAIKEYFMDSRNIEIINRLKQYGLKFEIEKKAVKSNKLLGKTIVISGTFDHHSRDEYLAIIEDNGGKNASSVSSKTSFILAGKNMGPAKLEKASKFGIKIYNESDFLMLIQ